MSIRLPRQYTRAIPVDQSVLLKKAGQYFYCPEADQAAFTVRLDDANEMIVGAGRGWQAEPDEPGFDELRIVNTGGAVLNVTIEIGFGRPLDQRLTISGGVDVSKSATLATVADVALVAITATSIVAANAGRRAVMISNLTAGAIRVGDANVAAARGVQVPAGATITLETSAEVFGFSTPGGNVAVTEVLD